MLGRGSKRRDPLRTLFVELRRDYRTILALSLLAERRVERLRDSSVARVAIVALLPLQRDALRALGTLLLQNGSGHLSLGVDLELEEGTPGILEARL